MLSSIKEAWIRGRHERDRSGKGWPTPARGRRNSRDSGPGWPERDLRRRGVFEAALSNDHTKRAYGRAVKRFLAWCEHEGIELRDVTPGLADKYMGQLQGSAPTKNQTLAALRHFFDGLVTRHAIVLNPFASVRGVKHSGAEGATSELSIEQ